jgi:hypothetical protein
MEEEPAREKLFLPTEKALIEEKQKIVSRIGEIEGKYEN